MNQTATQEAMILNLRKNRAVSLAAAVLRELQLDDRFPNEHLREANDALMEIFIRNGACIMTDAERSELGLEPRDFLGWTPSERAERERERMNATAQMMKFTDSLREGQGDG